MKKYLEKVGAKIEGALHNPIDQLHRWQLALRYAVGIFKFGERQLLEDRATEMAAALTYRTIFSLIPMFVIGLIVFNAFGGFDPIREDVQARLYDYLGLSISIPSESGGEGAAKPTFSERGLPAEAEGENPSVREGGQYPVSTQPAPQQQETRQTIDRLLADLTERASQVSVTSIGIVGLLVLIWGALALVISLEDGFNRIYRAPKGRPWHLRITIYWAVITLGPVLVAMSFYLTRGFLDWAQLIPGSGLLITLLSPFASLGVTWLLLLLLYGLLPNTTVSLRAAGYGALVGAILWELSKWGFRLYVSQAVGYSALYGTLGLIPLFLLWLYLTWLVILFGLEIAHTIQTVELRQFIHPPDVDQPEPMLNHGWIVAMALAFGRAFDDARPRSLSGVAEDLCIPQGVAHRLGRALCEAGLLHRVDDSDEQRINYSLSQPSEHIRVRRLLELGRRAAGEPSVHAIPSGAFLDELRDAELTAAGDQSLRDLLDRERRVAADEAPGGDDR